MSTHPHRDDDAERLTIDYLDRLFGEGSGRRHAAFLARIDNDALREQLHRYHGIEADTRHLTHAENYLLGACVLYALGRDATAGMFVKTLLHLGVGKEKILEAIGRLAMWAGGIAAAEASMHAQRAIAEWEAKGQGSLDAWFPGEHGAAGARAR